MPDQHHIVNGKTLYMRLLKYFKPYLSIAILTIFFMVLSGGIEAYIVRLLKDVVDSFPQLAAGSQSLWWIPVLIFFVAVARLAVTYGYQYLSTWLSARVTHDLREQMYQRLMNMPVSIYDRSSVGELLSRVTHDVNGITAAGLNVVTVIVRDGVMVIGLLGILFYTDWKLALFCALLIPGVGVSMHLVSKRQRRLSLESQESMGSMARVLNESLSGQRIVKIFTAQDYEIGRFGKINQLLRSLTIKRATTAALNSGFNLFLVAIAISLILYFAGLRAQDGSLTAGDFVSFMGAMLFLQQPIKKLTRVNDQLQRGLAAAQTVFALIDQPVEKNLGTVHISRAQGLLELSNVGFSYLDDGPAVLRGVNLTVEPGEMVAFVGASGSGKSTLVNLIARFYHGYTGEIKLDGVSIKEYELLDYRQQFSIVSQDVALFNDSVIANIAYADKNPDLEKVYAAARAAFAEEFILSLPHGYDEILGEDGVRLSGGQRQRIAIARALYRDAPILILDEATSALDNESEKKVQEAVGMLMKDRTTLVIAHRLSTIEKADLIVVMQTGEIVERGAHEELLNMTGLYSAMYFARANDSEQDYLP